MKKRLSAIIIGIVASSMAAIMSMAQTTIKTQNFVTGISAIEASDAFVVTLKSGEESSVTWTVDNLIKDYVEVYVKSKVLHLEFNRKGMSSELKKTYRGSKAPKPVLKAEVTLKNLESLLLEGEVTVSAQEGAEFYADSFGLTATGSTKVSGLNLVITNGSNIELSKNAQANLTLYSGGELNAKTSNSAILSLDQESGSLNCTSAGSSSIISKGTVKKTVSVNSQNSSKVQVEGAAGSLVIRTQGGSCEVDASSLAVPSAEVVMNGSAKAAVAASDKLKVEIKDGSLVFGGDPKIEVVSIVKGSLTRK